MLQSALAFAMGKAKEVKKKDQASLKRQEEVKAKKIELLKKKKMEAASVACIDQLYYFEMYHSPRCWKTAEAVDDGLEYLASNTAKLEEIKEQIRIRVLGLGWQDLHHPWSKNGVQYSAEQLASHLKDKIIPEESRRSIPVESPVTLPERKPLPVLGTLSADVVKINESSQEMSKDLRDKAVEQRNKLEQQGNGDRTGERQPIIPPVMDSSMVNRRIEYCHQYAVEDGSESESGTMLVWCPATIEAVFAPTKTYTAANIRWDKDILDKDEDPLSRQKFNPKLWNKTKHGGWRFTEEELKKMVSDEVDGSGDGLLLKDYKSNRDLMADFRKGSDLRQRSCVSVSDENEKK